MFYLLQLSAYENVTECSETSALKIQTPRNYPEESMQHSENGESLKSRITKNMITHEAAASKSIEFCAMNMATKNYYCTDFVL
jgi:hypothetical protein